MPDPLTYSLTSHEVVTAAPFGQRSESLVPYYQSQYGFGDWVRLSGIYPTSQQSAPWYGLPRPASGTTLDRKDGRNLPLVWSELELRGYRLLARALCEWNGFAIGFLDTLVNYHVGKGCAWQACRLGAKKGAYQSGQAEDPLLTKAQTILDRWRNWQEWPLKSREAFKRWRRDGEVFLRFFYGGWNKLGPCRFVEPEQVGDPDGETDGDSTFGIETESEDVETALNYFVRELNGDGREGEWVDADEVLHLKANVDSTIKRGITDFLPLLDDLDGVNRLLRNILQTGSAQAAVAWIEKFPTATVDQVRNLLPQYGGPGANQPTQQLIPQSPYGGPATNPGNQLAPGTVLRMEGNRIREPGPTADGIPNFIQAAQSALRMCLSRWQLPEYMTADASNNNFASALVAGSPFVAAIEGNQVTWGIFERKTAMKVLSKAKEAGFITQAELDQLDVEVTLPAVVQPDPKAETDNNNTKLQNKTLSPQEAIQKDGRDPAHVVANWKAWDAMFPQSGVGTGPATGPDQGQEMPPDEPPPEDDGSGDTVLDTGDDQEFEVTIGESVSEGAPGPPPRPGLVWNDGSHRWVRNKTGKAAGDKSSAGHSTTLPKDRKKLTIQQAGTALAQMGYKLGKSKVDLKNKTTTYELTKPDGSKTTASTDEIKEIVYRGAGGGKKTPPPLPAQAPTKPNLSKPDAKAAIDRGKDFAAKAADQHAFAIAAHFGIDRPTAKHVLKTSIHAAIAKAVKDGVGTVEVPGKDGKKIKITVRYKPKAKQESVDGEPDVDEFGIEIDNEEST